MKYPAVTTYLSPTAAIIKKRIDAVMNIRKFGKVIPFTIAFFSVLLLSQTVYAASDDDMRFLEYVYTDPYPMEADPYIISDEWRSAKGSSAEEAGEKIFRQYMEMYMGDDVPEYYRINEYLLQEVIPCDFKKTEKGEERIATKGIFTSHEYVYFKYSYIPANECGNTVHNMNLGGDLHINGVYNDCQMSFELEKQGGTYTVVNMGTTLTLAIDMPFHFENNLKYIIDKAESMAQAGLLDYSWNDTDNLPAPDDICKHAYILQRRNGSYEYAVGHEDEIIVPGRIYFRGNDIHINRDYVETAGCLTETADGIKIIDPEKISIDESKGFEYCGYDACLESKDAVIYGNVTGENPHGVKFYLNNEGDEYNSHYGRRLRSVEVTDELFTPHVFHDSFADIPLPDSLTGAEEILEYMKTPRDGCDFTVMDYRDITEEADGTYAYVRFKGRLDGLYSVDLTYKDGDGYIKTKIV